MLITILRDVVFYSRASHLKTDLVRFLIDTLEFSDGSENCLGPTFSSWEFLVFLIEGDKDSFYSINHHTLDQRRRIYPKVQSLAVQTVVMFLKDISENLPRLILGEIWTRARSTLFLEWFTEITKSADRMVYKDTGWTLLNVVIKEGFRSPPYYWRWELKDYLQLQTAKIKLLVSMGGSAHYNACKASIHPCEESIIPDLILTPYGCTMLIKILQEFEISIEHYVEQELKEGPLNQFGWSKEALMHVFLKGNYVRHHMNYFHWSLAKSNPCHWCNGSWALIPKSWLDYLEALKMGQDPNDLYPSHESITYDDEETIHSEEKHDGSDGNREKCDEGTLNVRENHKVAQHKESYNSQNISEKKDEESPEDDEEFYTESHEESAEQSKIWYCFDCAEKIFYGSDVESAKQDSESRTFSMPGSYE